MLPVGLRSDISFCLEIHVTWCEISFHSISISTKKEKNSVPHLVIHICIRSIISSRTILREWAMNGICTASIQTVFKLLYHQLLFATLFCSLHLTTYIRWNETIKFVQKLVLPDRKKIAVTVQPIVLLPWNVTKSVMCVMKAQTNLSGNCWRQIISTDQIVKRKMLKAQCWNFKRSAQSYGSQFEELWCKCKKALPSSSSFFFLFRLFFLFHYLHLYQWLVPRFSPWQWVS